MWHVMDPLAMIAVMWEGLASRGWRVSEIGGKAERRVVQRRRSVALEEARRKKWSVWRVAISLAVKQQSTRQASSDHGYVWERLSVHGSAGPGGGSGHIGLLCCVVVSVTENRTMG